MRSIALRGIIASLVLCLIAAFILRLALSRHPGYGYDVATNEGWMHTAAVLGVTESYRRQIDPVMLPNHGPVEIVVYGVFGNLYRIWHGFDDGVYEVRQPSHRIFMKLPGVAADLLAMVIVVLLLRGTIAAWGPAGFAGMVRVRRFLLRAGGFHQASRSDVSPVFPASSFAV
jgi:hypothetical protein